MSVEDSKKFLAKFLQEWEVTHDELQQKYSEEDLRKAVESILGWSTVQLIKKERSISLTDLQTDLSELRPIIFPEEQS